MKNKLLKKISVILLVLCLVIPVAAIMVMKSDAADSTLEEEVYEEGYSKSIVDLVKVKKAGDGTDIDGDATNGGLSDLEQMRNYIVEKTDAFYRTQGVKYEYDSTNACYYVTSNQSCSAGITKAEGTLTVLSTYNDATNGEAKVTTVAENAFLDCTDVKAAVMPTVTTLGTNAFKGCSELETAVIKNRFELRNDSFPGSDMAVDICVLGSEEPELAMQDASDNTINAGLSGAVFLQNTSGACETWKYNESGAVVKAQHRHTYGADAVCTNANCKMESVNGVAFEKNYFPARSAKSVTVEQVASYTDDNLKTEMNVAKITTVSNSMKVGDFVIDFPEDIAEKIQLRILIPKSDGTIYFRTVKAQSGVEDITSNDHIIGVNGLYEGKANVWLDYTVDLTNTSKAYKDQLTVQTTTKTAGEETTFYVAYAVDPDKVREDLKSDLKLDYVADFDSLSYRHLITDGITKGQTLKTEWLSSFAGEKGVMKVTVTGTDNWQDFDIALPKSYDESYTLRIYVSSNTTSSQVGTRNANGINWGLNQATLGKTKDSWQSVTLSGDEGYNGEKINITGFKSGGATLEVYLAWIYKGTPVVKDLLAADLSANYLADFDSSLYQDLISENVNSNGLTKTWLSSFEGEEGVMKVELTSGATGKDFLITLPKSHSGKYTLRMYISSNTKVKQIGTCKSTGPGWANPFYIDGYPTDSWQTITVDDSSADFNKEKIGIMGYGGSAPLEVYLAWIYDGTAEDWTKDTLVADLPAKYYVADFDSALYKDLISTGSDKSDTLETEWLSSFENEEGVLRVKVTGSSTWKDFAITLPKSYTSTYTLRMYVKSSTNVRDVGTKTATGAWGKWSDAGFNTYDKWQNILVTDTKDEGYSKAKISLGGYGGGNTFEVYLAWILDGCNNITTAEETWRANTTSAVKTTLQSTLGDGYLADFSSADYTSLVFGCNDFARDPKSIAASYLESYTDTQNVSHDGVLQVEVVGDKTGDFLVELPKSITQDSIKLRYAVVYEDGTKDSTDHLRFKYPEKSDVTGMYDTNGSIADLIGDGAWHEIEVKWKSSVKDYLEFQLDTDTSGEKVTIYFDEVTEAIP